MTGRTKENRKHIMILGAGVMQLPALRTARANGWFSIAVDGNAEAIGVNEADAFAHIDLKDYRAICRAAEGYQARGMLDGVFTAGTDFSPSVAYVAERLGLPGIPFEVALDARDKVRMRRRLRAARVASPGFLAVSREETESSDLERGLRERAAGLTLPLVVKPVDNMGARGVRRVHAVSGLGSAVRAGLEQSAGGMVIVEEFIEGPEFSLDALVVDGTVHVCGIADRHIAFAPHFVEMGHTLPTAFGRAERAELVAAFERGIEALGIRTGAAKGDIFLTEDGAMVGEIAARLSGGYMSGWTFPYATGVPLTESAMRIALGMDPGNLEPRWKAVSAERAFISIPGRVRAMEGTQAARAMSGVKELFLRTKAGDTVRLPRNNVEKCGNVIAAGSTRGEAVQSAETAVSRLLVVLEPGERATLEYLFGPGSCLDADERGDTDAEGEGDGEGRAAAFRTPGEEVYRSYRRMDIRMPGKECRHVIRLNGIEGDAGRDWSYRTLAETMRELTALRGIRYAGDRRTGSYGREFWHALLKGGLQGGLFFLDTAREKPGLLREYVRKWAERQESC